MQIIGTNRKTLLFGVLALIFDGLTLTAYSQTATINAGTVYQTIDGFGAATHQYTPPITGAQAALFFSPTSGVGLSLMRSEVPDDGSCTTVNSACAGVELADMQKAAAYGVKIWSAPWSPPASMKTNGNIVCDTGSGSSSLAAGSYGAYATYLSNYIASAAQQGINIYGVSVQNEPDYCPNTYDGAIWSNQNLHDFILNNLGPTLAANGQSSVKIVMPESSQWAGFGSLASTTMNDPTVASKVGVLAFHGYDNSTSISNPYSGPSFWQTEVSAAPGYGPSLCGGCWDPSMADALMWANIIQSNLTGAHVSAWHYWLLYSYDNYNSGLLNSSGAASKRLYALGNWSKFVRPGWVMIDATNSPQSGVQVSAFKNPSTGAFAIVAINSNGSSVSQLFTLNGISTSSVTPYVTDANNNLAGQSAISVSSSGFTATLNASSVTTFVAAASGPGAPSNLTATVVP